ncbi:MAG: tetratricopeptide repeat protein [Thermodesulfobacteriota bacterium]
MKRIYELLMMNLIVVFTIVMIPASDASSHPLTSELYNLLTDKIDKDPTNSELYLKRGEVLRNSGQWDKALLDFERSSQYNPNLNQIFLAKGLIFQKAGWPYMAEFFLRRYLSTTPNHPKALLFLARSLSAQGRNIGAVDTYTEFLKINPNHKPDYFIERAKVQVALKRYEDTVKGLDEALNLLGPITSLNKMALEIQIKNKSYNAALMRLNSLINNSPQREVWMMRRGEVFELMGNIKEAKSSFEEALISIEKRPEHRRRVPALVGLKEKIKYSLARIEGETGNSAN